MSKNSEKKTLVLLDAHAILHRAYHALPDFASPTGEPTGALYGVVTMLLKIVEELKPTHVVACFDLPDPTYRHDAYEHYKAGRTKTDDALVAQITRSRDIFRVFGIPIYECVGFEADDMLGTIVEQTAGDKDLTVIIASGDMDTLQLVEKKQVMVYTLKKGIKDTILYDESTVKERFGFPPKLVPDYKGLRGDPSDNIPGIVGIGEKTATEIITQFGSIDSLYKKLHKDEAAFVTAGIKPRIISLLKEGEEEARFSFMLATIRRDAPITFALPNAKWKDRVDTEAVLTLFTELGFRSLTTRIKALWNLATVAEEVVPTLDPTAATELKIALWLLDSDATNPTDDDVIDYARAHFKTTNVSELKERLFADLKEQSLWELFETIELPLIPILEAMRQRGIKLDTEYLKTLSVKFHNELTSLEQGIYSAAGMEFNINSPKQLGDVLYDHIGLKPHHQKKTATGQRSTKESELEKMREDHPIIEHILRYRELQKLVSTYIDNLPTMVWPDGRLHSTLVQTGTTTGRVASKDPNLQNIPVRTEEGRAVRQAFIAEEGFSLVSIDYSQIELRIAAMLSGDNGLLDIFRRGEDVHIGVAVRVFGVAPEEVTKEMRRKAKIINFGILYGMGVNALRQNLGEGTTREEAQHFLNAYFQTFSRLAEYLEETKALARSNGYTLTMYGRRRHFPGIMSGAPFIRAQAERMAINAPIQGTEGDILRIAMIRIDAYLNEQNLQDKVRMLLQVHDELVFEIENSLIPSVVPELIRLMESVMDGVDTKGVPVVVEAATGSNWHELTAWQK